MLDKMFVQAQVEKGTFNDEEQSFVAWASRPVLDRDNEIIAWNAWDLTNYNLNPTILWAHEYRSFPLGSSQWTKKTRQGLKFKPAFTRAYPDGTIVYLLYQDGSLRAFSVGFTPKQWIRNEDEDKGIWSLWKRINDEESEQIGYYFDVQRGWTESKAAEWNTTYDPIVLDIAAEFELKATEPKPDRIYTKAELLEVSCVPVGSCPTALVEAYRSGSIKIKGLAEYVESSIAGDIEGKGATAHVSLPLMPEDAAWNPGGVADSQIIEAILGRDPADGEWTAQMNANAKKVNCWWDGKGGKIGAFKLKVGRRDPITDKSAPLKYNWHQTANRMAILMGGRGGVDIPDADRKPVYNRLVKVYKMFDKEPPEFREYRPETLDIIELAVKYSLDKLPINWNLMDKLEPELHTWTDTVSAFHNGKDADVDIDDIRPDELKDVFIKAIDEIFKPSGEDDRDKHGEIPELADFDLDELPTPEEMMQLKKGKVL